MKWAALAAVAVVVLMTVKKSKLPRGIRNNNPGNIRHGDNWQGMKDHQRDSDFIQFEAPVYGIRAMAKLLNNYQRLYGLDTVAEIIGRWAPPNENDTTAYVESVARATGIPANQPIEVRAMLPKLIPAIIKHENGQQTYSPGEIAEGIALA